MKKWVSWLLLLAMVLTFSPVSAFAMEDIIYLPFNTETIEEEAFAGNTAIEKVFIPENVSSIGKNAFAYCTSLEEVIINRAGEIEIAEDAFAGVDLDRVHFIVLPDTPAELVCLSRGFICDRANPGTPHYDRIQQLVAEHGGTTELQSGSETMRLIVRRATNRLPDISMYNPVDVVRKNDVFVIQFDDSWNATDCMTALRADRRANGSPGDYEQYDQIVSANFFTVEAAGVIDPEGWGTDDPMGFDTYAPFVAQTGGGSAKIAVIDSGVRQASSYSHRLDMANARNMTDDGGEWYDDNAAHGSFVAAVIDECVGANNVSILPIRVVNNYTINSGNSDVNGNIDYALVGDAIDYAVERGATIINLSMCFSSCSYVEDCINKALDAGVIVVAAAGNKGQTIDSHVFPANLPQIITVAGIDSNYTLIGNYGPTIDYCAPFEWYQTAIGDNAGTSFAAPMIASALALVTMDPYHTVDDMNNVCHNQNETGTGGNSYGFGMPHLDEMTEVPAQALSIDSSLPGELQVGQELSLKWSFVPENTTNQAVTVHSSDETVLTIMNDGKTVKAMKQGVAVLTVTSEKKPELSVNRTFTVVQPVTGITVVGAQDKLVMGRSMKLEAVIAPENATTREVEWISTNENLVTVNANGLVEVADGVTETDLINEPVAGVTARAKDGYGAQSDTISFKVVAIPDAERIDLFINGKNVTNSAISMTPGEVVQINTSVMPEDADQRVGFSPFGNYIEVSDDGVVKAVSAGTAHIQVYSVDNRDINANLEILVRVLPTSITLSGNTTINEGQTTTLAATVLPENATDKSVSWRSSNPSVAKVSASGVVTGVSKGEALITAVANGDPNNPDNTKAITVTVRHPYVLNFNANTPEPNVLTPSLSSISKTAYSGEALGTLPTPSCNYYDFLGWYTAASGGERKTDNSVINTTASSETLYAQWRIHDESEWVLTSAMPSDARKTSTSYSYRESTESTDSSKAGWIPSGNYWNKTGSGSKQFASFPSTYDTSHWTYRELNGSAYEPYTNESTKREVSNSHTGYVYWHWAYNARYYNTTNRWISDREQNAGPKQGLEEYNYCYFYAFKSTTDAPLLSIDQVSWVFGANAKHDKSIRSYNCANCLPSGADTSATSGLNNPRFLRFDYFTSTYTDYQKIYKYYRDLNYQAEDPGSGENITNKMTYVKYIPR